MKDATRGEAVALSQRADEQRGMKTVGERAAERIVCEVGLDALTSLPLFSTAPHLLTAWTRRIASVVDALAGEVAAEALEQAADEIVPPKHGVGQLHVTDGGVVYDVGGAYRDGVEWARKLLRERAAKRNGRRP